VSVLNALLSELPSTTSLPTGELAEKSFFGCLLEGESRSMGPILSLLDPNGRNMRRYFPLIQRLSST
jgi:hypothetical protein